MRSKGCFTKLVCWSWSLWGAGAVSSSADLVSSAWGTCGQLGTDTGASSLATPSQRAVGHRKMGKKGLEYSSPLEGWVVIPVWGCRAHGKRCVQRLQAGNLWQGFRRALWWGKQAAFWARTRASANVRLADRMEKPIIYYLMQQQTFLICPPSNGKGNEKGL